MSKKTDKSNKGKKKWGVISQRDSTNRNGESGNLKST